MIQDPAGLLQRIVELEPLCADPGIRRAVESGDTFKVYRAILWARLLGRLSARRATLDTLARNRRAFAKPISGTPMLGTLNSFGATLLGRAEEEPDGTCISTHYVVVLFALPLFPIGAYVVRPGERKGLSSSWQVFAKVPLAATTWLWSRGIALGVLLAIAWAGLGALHSARHHDVHLVNGLGVPVRATIGKATVELPAGGRQVLNLPTGSHQAWASAGDRALDPVHLDVNSGSEVLVWNVAGGAPVMENLIKYSSAALPKDEHPRQTLHCGEEVIRLPRVDDLFADPPQSVQIPKDSKVSFRRHLTVADTGKAPGWQACVSLLLSQGKTAEGVHLLERRARLASWTSELASAAVQMALTVSPAEGERVARLTAQALPDDTLVQRAWQNALLETGKEAEVLAEARRRAAAAPDSAQAQYLLARVLRGKEQEEAVDRLVARFPKDADALRLATALRAEAGDWPAVDRLWRALAAVSMPQAREVLRDEAAALVALGRPAEALAVLKQAFEALPDDGSRSEPAVAYALVAVRAKAPEPDALVKLLEKDGPNRWLRARAGLPVSEADDRYAAFVAAVRRDAAAALALAPQLTDVELLQVDHDVWGLAYAEAVRAGASDAARALERRSQVTPAEREELKRYVRGEAGAPPGGIQRVLLAAAELVRSRNPSLPAAERSRLVAQARKDDPLGTSVTQASFAWKAPDAAR